MLKSPIGVFAILIVLAWPAATSAQVVYKLVDKNGKTVYSDHVIPGMKVVGKLTPPPQPDPELAAAAHAAQTERAQRAQAYAQERIRALDAADAKIRAAEQRLAAARQALEAGSEPLPGEQLGTVRKGTRGTFTRFSDEYWERIADLEHEVVKATKELERAYSERNALRD
jgi:hypothetical protein